MSNTQLNFRKTPLIRLSRRQRQVLQMMVHGLSTKQIALELGICYGTTKHHVRQVLKKMGVGKRTRAVVMAIQITREINDVQA